MENNLDFLMPMDNVATVRPSSVFAKEEILGAVRRTSDGNQSVKVLSVWGSAEKLSRKRGERKGQKLNSGKAAASASARATAEEFTRGSARHECELTQPGKRTCARSAYVRRARRRGGQPRPEVDAAAAPAASVISGEGSEAVALPMTEVCGQRCR